MKKLLISAVLLLFVTISHAQILQPVKWSYAAKKINKTEAIVYLKATIDEGWHLYSQFIKPGGPVKTTFAFTPSADYATVGGVQEPKPITHMEKVFGMDVSYFEKGVVFQQKVKIKKARALVKGTVEYMVCNDQKCLPPESIEFSIPVK